MIKSSVDIPAVKMSRSSLVPHVIAMNVGTVEFLCYYFAKALIKRLRGVKLIGVSFSHTQSWISLRPGGEASPASRMTYKSGSQ